jgi:CBS domain-containing protein
MKEFVDFLGSQSPYANLSPGDLERLARTVEVEFFPQGHEIIRSGERGVDHIYVIRTGSAEVSDRGRVVDVLAAGDTFGHIAVFSGLPPAMSVHAIEDTLCYRMPDPRSVVADASRLEFHHYSTLVAPQRLIEAASVQSRMEMKVTAAARPVTWCKPGATVQEAARFMTMHGLRNVLIRKGNDLGIVTDSDFRARVGTGDVPLDATIDRIASSPVHTASESSTMWDAYLRMIRENVHNMVVVDTENHPVGTINIIDMATSDVRHPLAVRSAVSAAGNVKELREACELLKPTIVELAEAKVSSVHVGAVIATVVDAILLKTIDFGLNPPAELDESWLLTGSMARHEPLPDSDIDTAVLWQSPIEQSSELIVRRAQDLTSKFESIGLRACPDGANASAALFNRSDRDWRSAIERWVENPHVPKHLVLASTAADSRPITRAYLGQQVRDHLVERAHAHPAFLRALLRSALHQQPPVGFVRNTVIGRFGEGQRYLDLKEAGIRPIASLSRVLAIQAGDASGSTIQRLERATSAGLLSNDEGDILGSAFGLYHGLLTENRVQALRKSEEPRTLIMPDHLDPLTRRHLREGFRATSQIQERFRRDLNSLRRI